MLVAYDPVESRRIGQWLEETGCTVASAGGSAGEVVARAREVNPDLILFHLASMDSYGGLQAVGRKIRDYGTPVIFTFDEQDEILAERAAGIQPCGFLQMPLKKKVLQGLVGSVIGKYKAMLALRHSEEHFQKLQDRGSDCIMETGRDKQLKSVSASVERILGYEPSELKGTNLSGLIHEDDLALFQETCSRVLRGQVEDLTIELRFRHSKGHWTYLETTVTNLEHEAEKPGLLFLSRDITDRKKMEFEQIRARDAADRMNRIKTALLANISHEMRLPLTGILGFANILEMELPEGETREMAGRIHSSGQRLLGTVETILDLVNLEADKVEVNPEKIDLVDEIEQSVGAHAQAADSKDLKLSVKKKVAELNMVIDRKLFQRIMYNLLANAIKYTDEGGVSVEVSQYKKIKEEWAKITVRDTGIGISESFLSRVFNEFEQESTGMDRRFEGTGLGLAVTRKLVEVLGGNISVDSQKGKGSVFTVRLPIVADKEKKTDLGSDKIGKRGKSTRNRILLVEDDYDAWMITRYYLGNAYELKRVQSGEEALQKLNDLEFDLVLLDINLGMGMDGVSAIKSIRSNAFLEHIPVLAMTDHSWSGSAEYFRKQGFTASLTKPFRKDELLKIVSEHLENPEKTKKTAG